MARWHEVLASKPVNLLLFNGIWACCVFGRNQLIWLSILLTLGYLSFLFHRGVVKASQILPVAVAGIVVDSGFTAFGLFQFSGDSYFIPAWLVVLWFAFASTMPLSLSPIGKHKWVAALAGGTGLPFNYFVGERLGAVSFGQPLHITVIAMSAVWVILLPLLFVVVDGSWRKHYADVSARF